MIGDFDVVRTDFRPRLAADGHEGGQAQQDKGERSDERAAVRCERIQHGDTDP
jgi:hypothetical protein